MREAKLKRELNWKTRHRIKAWSARVLFFVTFLLVGSTTTGLGALIFPISFLPGFALYLFLWPKVLTPEPLPEHVRRRISMLQIVLFSAILIACLALRFFAGM